ncbi:hypothetical protein U3516DRAFT_844067 [Neocallimastix sp. 'constans']
MKSTIALTSVVTLIDKTSSACWCQKHIYPCYSSSSAEDWNIDGDGKFGVENNDRCGIPADESASCWSESLVEYTDNDGKWCIENANWCSINSNNSNSGPKPNPRNGENPIPEEQ